MKKTKEKKIISSNPVFSVSSFWLARIHEKAVKKDWDGVREILQKHLFTYREAQLYCERVKNDYEASEYILKQATCYKCGGVVDKWEFRKKPMCGGCSFRDAMSKIEYGSKPK